MYRRRINDEPKTKAKVSAPLLGNAVAAVTAEPPPGPPAPTDKEQADVEKMISFQKKDAADAAVANTTARKEKGLAEGGQLYKLPPQRTDVAVEIVGVMRAQMDQQSSLFSSMAQSAAMDSYDRMSERIRNACTDQERAELEELLSLARQSMAKSMRESLGKK